MKKLVIFDIDGTLLDGQSQKFFIKYLLSIKQISYVFYFRILFWFILYKIGIVKKPEGPMRYAFSFLKGKSVSNFSEITRDFFEKELKKHFYLEALEIIREYRKKGDDVILISNAVDMLVQEIARFLELPNYFCTTLEVKDGYYTGGVRNILYGEKKTSCIKDISVSGGFDLKNAWAYSDHISDKPLLSLVGNPVVVNPSRALFFLAKRKKWKIVFWKRCLMSDILN